MLPDDHSGVPICQDDDPDVTDVPVSAPCHQITGPVTLDTALRHIMSYNVTCHNFRAPDGQ